jgi:hypothetical protein
VSRRSVRRSDCSTCLAAEGECLPGQRASTNCSLAG